MSQAPCPCELTAKVGSPGLVVADEWLVHLLFEGDNWLNNEVINASVMKRLKEYELSVARPDHCTEVIIRDEVISKRLNANAQLKFVGSIRARCVAVRKLMSTSEADRLFCVSDDPVLPNFTGHALIGFSNYPKDIKDYWKKNLRSAAAANLIAEFMNAGGPHPLESNFAGSDMPKDTKGSVGDPA